MERCAWCKREMTTHSELAAHFSCPAEAGVRASDEPCPAWTDGQHLFLAIYRDCEGFAGITPQPETRFSGLKSKRCACGATVERTK